MSQRRGAHDFVYVDTDIPEGMTIGAWRARRAAERITTKTAARDETRRRRARAIRRWLVAPAVALPRPWPGGRAANG